MQKFDETTSCQKTSCRTLVRQLVYWLLVVSSFINFKMHAWLTSMLLLLHFAFMLSGVKMLLKGEVGGSAFNSHRSNNVDHGKSWKNHGIMLLNFYGNPDSAFYRTCPWRSSCDQFRHYIVGMCSFLPIMMAFR